MTRPLKGSANYIWWEKDELGKGATATVYKCREKKTGDVYAVKVFSSRHRDRLLHHGESAQQEREFDLLKKLRHENIVKMLHIEEESQTMDRPPSRVIVMEYCNGGSLYSILEQPANAHGLDEDEFLLFLRHISEGLRYLRIHKVVHRDIKPGNIMKLITSEGRSIYKLTDFGAARELEENNERFTSLYGTEEYLHPDLYDRAVLRNHPFGAKASFTSSVDLWSVGVTIYHVATGSLPFRPHGGRRNRTDIGLKLLIIPLIAGLLEVNLAHCLSFEQYFAQVHSIISKVIVSVFDTCSCQHIKVYCDPNDNLRKMKELIDQQSKYKPHEQLLLYENSRLEDLLSDQGRSDRFPTTSADNPVYLFHCIDPIQGNVDHPAKPYTPKFPRFGSAYDLEKDYQLAKSCTGVMMYICTKVDLMLSLQASLDRAVKAYEHYLIRMVVLLRDNISMVVSTADEVRMRYQFMKNISSLPNIRDSNPTLLQHLPDLQAKCDEITMYMSDLRKYGEDYKEKIADRRELSHKWRRRNGCDKEKDMCYEKVTSMTQGVESCKSEFDRERKQKTLAYNEEQIHKFEKNKMSENCTSAMSLLEDHCWDRTRKMYKLFIQWFQMAFRIQAKIIKLKTKMEKLQLTQSELSRELKESDFELLRIVDKKTNSAGGGSSSAVTVTSTGVSDLSLNDHTDSFELHLNDNEHFSSEEREILNMAQQYGADLREAYSVATDNSNFVDEISSLTAHISR